jgi:hypothetical protein
MIKQTENQTHLTPEELQKFRDIHQEYQTALFNVGLITLDLENLTKEKDRLTEHAFKVNEQRLEIVKNLGDKYGDKQVNLETGELE